MRTFENWIDTMSETVSSWNYYTDFEKVFKNIEEIKVELNLLNTLIKSKNIKQDFRDLISRYPEILKVLPILIATRYEELLIKDGKKNYNFNFKKANYSVNDYVLFMEKTGIFNLLRNHLISSVYDYVTGIEVGLDTNARKNRTGDAMEDLVENYLIDLGLIKNIDYFKELNKSYIEKHWNIDLSKIGNKGKTEKRFDFVVIKNNKVFAIETNFYSSGGSKLNETARSYKSLFQESESIKNFEFIWITDGRGWKYAKNNLEETFNITNNIYNLNDLNNNILSKILK